MFRREWIVQINEMLNHDDDNPLPNTPAILRVPTPLLKMKPEAYIPQLLSFGPYHHSKLEKAIDSDSPCAERNISMAEAYKGKFAAMLSKELPCRGKSFKSIVEMMKRMRPEIESFYRWPTSTDGEYSQNFALMMAIDSSFLLQFLIMGSLDGSFVESTLSLDDGHEMERFITIYYSCICYDIVKMENQIPLFVLKEVFDYVKEASIVDESLPFNHLLQKICYQFCPLQYRFLDFDIAESERNILIDAMAKEPHFLGCLHKSLSLVLHMQPGGEEDHRRMRILLHKFNSIHKKLVTWIRFLPTVPEMEIQLQKFNALLKSFVKWIRCFLPETELLSPNGMSAVHLARAGIKFKSFYKMPDYIRLDKESGTLYLPHIIVGEIATELYLRNMLALEFNDALRPKYVTRYVALMGTLVQSPHDVRLLVDRQLLSRGYFSLTDECMAQMWHDLRQPLEAA